MQTPLFLLCRRQASTDYKMEINWSRLVLRSTNVTANHLSKYKVFIQTWQVDWKLCAFGTRADGFWLGSFGRVAFNASNIARTQRKRKMPAVQTHLLHINKQQKTNREHCLLNNHALPHEWLLFSLLSPLSSPLEINFLLNHSPCFLGITFQPSSSFQLGEQLPPFAAMWTPPLVFLPPSHFSLPPVRLLLCLMAFYSYVMVDGFM